MALTQKVGSMTARMS